MANRKATKSTPSTQSYMTISEIRDDAVIMKDGTLRSVLLVSSMNFALKSEEEQNAIVAGYISFLNSLDTTLQIVIQSRKLNLDNYLADIKRAEEEQANDLLKLQTSEYRKYISELVELGDIMTKKFYVVVYYNASFGKKRNFWERSTDVVSPTKLIKLSQKEFSKRHQELFIEVDKIISGLMSMGLRVSILNTQSLIELFYNTYNPTISESQKIADINKLDVEQ
ncbi:MAG: hypothetical protein Q7K65_00280 [Candidatus Buchananbacteria bacterium]|nr:hypothetical protein [Candidatus Buchananbacteria bacterium]